MLARMSYTRLVSYAAIPALVVVGGLLTGSSDGVAVAIAGAVALVFVLARFFDSRRKV